MPGWCEAAGGEVEAVPEQVHWLALPQYQPGEFLQDV